MIQSTQNKPFLEITNKVNEVCVYFRDRKLKESISENMVARSKIDIYGWISIR